MTEKIVPFHFTLSTSNEVVRCNELFSQFNVDDQRMKYQVKLDKFSMLNLIYSVPSAVQFSVDEDPTIRTVSISAGNYTTSSLASALQTALNAVSTFAYEINYDSINTGFFITCDSAHTFKVVYSSACPYLGFSLAAISAMSYSDKQSSDQMVDLSLPDYMYLSCSLVDSALVNTSRNDTLQKIFLNGVHGAMIYHQGQLDDWLDCAKSNAFSVGLRYENGEFVPVSSPWSVTLKFRQVPK